MKSPSNKEIILLEQFLEATRDAGYKSIVSALAELIDNALEANAKTIRIDIEKSTTGEIEVVINDDGGGMKPSVLQLALQFGGTTRFNSRLGTGRFGMGLPNSSFSQARRIDVFTWRNRKNIWHSYLDIDEIIIGKLKQIPAPRRLTSRTATTDSGTTVIWSKCDRIEFKRERYFLTKIRKTLGRLFRKYLYAGREIIVCGEKVIALDPLYLFQNDLDSAVPFGSKLEYEIAISNTHKNTATVTVQFVELPIEKWHSLSNQQKQIRGISKGAGVSIIRAGREVDYGWFFMGKKRKENYDDWWRCEICFTPELDEFFGVTNTKQGIRPKEILNNILSPDIERIAHTLNSRVRTRYAKVKAEFERSTGEKIASNRDHLLEPPQKGFPFNDNLSFYGLKVSRIPNNGQNNLIQGLNYRFEAKKIAERSFFIPLLTAREIVVLLNENHPFYECIFLPSMRSSTPDAKLLSQYLELTLLSAARAECTISPTDKKKVITKLREEWSRVLATFLE